MTVSKARLADDEARRRILTDFGTTLFVEAAAGTGKTTALVGRIVALICEGISTLDRVVAVTFTEKAAGEMKLRLRAEIERARNAADVTAERSARLAKALSQLELARIGTIHAFCGDLLRERPVEAGIDPLFEVAAEDQAGDLMDRAFDNWFQNLPSTLAADESAGGDVQITFRRIIVHPGGREEIEGVTPKALPVPDASHALPRPTDPTDDTNDGAV